MSNDAGVRVLVPIADAFQPDLVQAAVSGGLNNVYQTIVIVLVVVMLFLGGAGPPPEVLTGVMRAMSDVTPLWHAVLIMQDAWLGLDAGLSWMVFCAIGVVSAILGLRFFRWE